MRLPALLAGLAACTLLAGCESDAKKLERLQQDKAVACIQVVALNNRNAPSDSVYAAQTACTLAERDLNRFMQGR